MEKLLTALFWVLLLSPIVAGQSIFEKNVKEILTGLQQNTNFVVVGELRNGAALYAMPNLNDKGVDAFLEQCLNNNVVWLRTNFMTRLFHRSQPGYKFWMCFRSRSTPSLQITVHRSLSGEYYYELDIDKYLPRPEQPWNVVRHTFFEVLPHWIVRGRTPQRQIALRLARKPWR